jgi:hypothetical protein
LANAFGSRPPAAGRLRDRHAVLVVDLAIERREPSGQGRQRVVIATARGDVLEQPVEADCAVALQRLRNML